MVLSEAVCSGSVIFPCMFDLFMDGLSRDVSSRLLERTGL